MAYESKFKRDDIDELFKAVLLLKDEEERPFRTGDVVRFAPGEIHGAHNDGTEAFVYLSATSPPQSFDRAYKNRI